jgi:hypothetical protein
MLHPVYQGTVLYHVILLMFPTALDVGGHTQMRSPLHDLPKRSQLEMGVEL